jgi:hypothetical protein
MAPRSVKSSPERLTEGEHTERNREIPQKKMRKRSSLKK